MNMMQHMMGTITHNLSFSTQNLTYNPKKNSFSQLLTVSLFSHIFKPVCVCYIFLPPLHTLHPLQPELERSVKFGPDILINRYIITDLAARMRHTTSSAGRNPWMT